MKKILLASVAFAGFATAAAAEITLSGGGYVGVNGTMGTGGSMAYDSRFQINVDGKVESDSGVSVSARTRIRTEEGTAGVASLPRIDVSVAGLTVSFGNTDSAIRARSNPWASCVGNVGDFCASGIVGSGFSSVPGFATAPVGNAIGESDVADAVRVDYSMGDHTFSLSDSVSGAAPTQIGYSGKFGGYGVNVGYQMAEGAAPSAYALDVNGAFGSVNVGLRHEGTGDSSWQNTALYGNTTFGATTVSAFVGDTNVSDTYWGLGVSHDLGGGVAIGAALAGASGSSTTAAQAHLSFEF